MTEATKAEAVVYAFANPVRSGFSNIVKARPFEMAGREKGDPRFDATFIIEPDSADLKTIQSLCIAELKKLYPGKRLVTHRLTAEEAADGGFREVVVPWRDGTKAADEAKGKGRDQEFFRGKITLKASSKFAPALSGIEGGKVIAYTNPETRPTLDKLFYPGAYLVPYVQVHTYMEKGSPDQSGYKPGGVSLWLNAVCFIKHGPRLSGGGSVNAAEVFKAYAGTVSAEDPTAGDDLSEL